MERAEQHGSWRDPEPPNQTGGEPLHSANVMVYVIKGIWT